MELTLYPEIMSLGLSWETDLSLFFSVGIIRSSLYLIITSGNTLKGCSPLADNGSDIDILCINARIYCRLFKDKNNAGSRQQGP